MAGILYGVAGEGFGHSSRAREVARHLERAGHDVRIISYDRGFRALREHFDVMEIFGLHLTYVDHHVRYLPTVLENLLKLPDAAESILRVRKLVEEFRPHLVLSDFEPIAGLMANLYRIPLISIDNQHLLTRTDTTYPKEHEQDAIAARTVTRLILHGCAAYMVTAFHHARVTKPHTVMVPPILRQEVLDLHPTDGAHVLVYSTAPHEELIPMLRATHRERFIVYGYPHRGRRGNITFRKPNATTFQRDLASCRAVIASAGFTLLTEALHLRKPQLLVPVQNQFEQIVNAHALTALGFGVAWNDITRERIEAFLYNREDYVQRLARYRSRGNLQAFRVLDRLIVKHAKGNDV